MWESLWDERAWIDVEIARALLVFLGSRGFCVQFLLLFEFCQVLSLSIVQLRPFGGFDCVFDAWWWVNVIILSVVLSKQEKP
jgi:hypothetical protein